MPTLKHLTVVPGLRDPSFRWDKMKDREVLSRAQRAVERKNIPDPHSFSVTFRGISFEMRKRGLLLTDLDYSRKTKDWNDMSDDEFLRRAQEVIDRYGISDWNTFRSVCKGLFAQLSIRELPREELSFSD